jgi:MoxR-like ATPase
LNILLTIINEKKFYQDGIPEPVPLRILFAATNEIPEQGELAALKDRFVLKVMSRPVQDEFFQELIDAGLRGEANKGLNQKPWVEGHAQLDDFIKANRYLTFQFSRKKHDARGEELNDRDLYFPADVFREYQRLVKTLIREDKIFISDRKLVKLYKLFRVRSWLFSGGTVTRDDLGMLAYLGETLQEIEHLRVKVPELLGSS